MREIVERHKGFITLNTELGRGTTFRIYLPAAESPASTDTATAAPPDRGHGELILLVDDEQTIRDTAAAVLTEAGYRVVTAGDGVEAVSLFASRGSEIVLVVTDLDMPQIDGDALTTSIRSLAPNMKILTMSGLENKRIHAPATTSSSFLLKPFTMEELLIQVQHLLRVGHQTL